MVNMFTLITTAALSVAALSPGFGEIDTIEPIGTALVGMYFDTYDEGSACAAYESAGLLAIELGGDASDVQLMLDMAEAYLVVQFETVWSNEMDGTHRLTDDARDAYHDHLAGC